MLTQRFREYLRRAFEAAPATKEADDLRAEFMDALTSRAMDLKVSGMSDDEIYNICVEALGDISGPIKSLKSNPITLVRDNRFWLKILYGGAFMLLAVITYLAVSFATGIWGTTAVIIFPSAAGILFIASTALVLKRNIALKRHYTTDLILAAYGILLVLVIYFVTSFALRFDLAKTWSVFTLIPALTLAASIVTFKVFRGRKTPLVIYMFFLPALSVGAYLVSASITGLYHPLWIIVLLGVAADIGILIARLSKKEAERR